MCKICKNLFKQQATVAWWFGNQWEAQVSIKEPNHPVNSANKYSKKRAVHAYREKKHQRELGYRLNKRSK